MMPIKTFALSALGDYDVDGTSLIGLESLTGTEPCRRLGCRGNDTSLVDYVSPSDVGESFNSVPLVCNITLNNATNVTPTYLHSGTTIHCVKDRQRFTKYRLEQSDGNTADAAFVIEGRGIAQFDVKVNGVIKCILLDAVHTPLFTMSLISIPALDV